MIDLDNLDPDALRFLMLSGVDDKDKYKEDFSHFGEEAHTDFDWLVIDLHIYSEPTPSKDIILDQISDLDLKLLECQKLGRKKVKLIVGKGKGLLKREVYRKLQELKFVQILPEQHVSEIRVRLQ